MVGFETEHHDLVTACALVQALLDSSASPAAESELQRRQCAAQKLFEQLPTAAAVVVVGAEPTCNARWLALFGMEQPLPACVSELCISVRSTGATLHRPQLAIPTLRERYVALTLTPLASASGVILTCTEITDDVIARKLCVGPDALVWGGAVARSADYYNARWRSACGTARGWIRVVHPDDVMRCIDAFGEAARQRVSAPIETRIRIGTEDRWHRVRFTSSPECGWYGSAVDIHDASITAERNELFESARAARADAEQANRLKDEFLAVVSHELRAPVTTMLLWERVLRDESIDAAARAQALDAIHHSAVAQSRLVGDLLDVSRTISGKLRVDIRPIALSKLVGGSVEAARPSALAKGIELQCDNASDHEEIDGDATRLGQVLDNLLSNAIKFTPPGGSVRIEVRRDSTTIEIVVEDTGRGIAPDFIGRIFEPFSQCDDALTRREGGLGLGLAISRKLVELHRGTLTACSAGRGLGTTMTLTLPAIGASHAPNVPARPQRRLALAGIRLLLVDDDIRVRQALSLLLQRAGAIVETASSAALARAAIATSPPDVILCDIGMPDEDGYSFIRTVRASQNQTPAIALTAYATDRDADRAIDAGFDLHVAKPIHLERIVAFIADLHGAHVDELQH